MIYSLLWLFIIYSFAGWIIETIFGVLRQKKFVNRGVINGPFCIIYGSGVVFITLFTGELTGFWLYAGCVILLALVEWVSGHIIEKVYHERWWDYSSLKWNIDGYVSLYTSIIWGALGYISVKYVNRLLIDIYKLLPSVVAKVLVLAIICLIVIDGMATTFILTGKSRYEKQWKATDEFLDSVSNRLSEKIAIKVNNRLNKAYEKRKKAKKEENPSDVFAYGASFYKIMLLFFIGAFLGDITETIFCRITAGVWMSRSSVVWGPFSIVWGLAIAFVTALLYQSRNKSDSFLFWMGTFLGGAYEYICSVFTEIVFGTVFWDYSSIPFNLGGRINLLYCFFWGIAAVVWFKVIYPFISRLIEKIPVKPGKIITWFLIVFMTADIIMSCMALIRYNERSNGVYRDSAIATWVDEHFDDVRMKKIYPNALKVEE